jgi:hypothetical protein
VSLAVIDFSVLLHNLAAPQGPDPARILLHSSLHR